MLIPYNVYRHFCFKIDFLSVNMQKWHFWSIDKARRIALIQKNLLLESISVKNVPCKYVIDTISHQTLRISFFRIPSLFWRGFNFEKSIPLMSHPSATSFSNNNDGNFKGHTKLWEYDSEKQFYYKKLRWKQKIAFSSYSFVLLSIIMVDGNSFDEPIQNTQQRGT